jgi:hypothetical protein
MKTALKSRVVFHELRITNYDTLPYAVAAIFSAFSRASSIVPTM